MGSIHPTLQSDNSVVKSHRLIEHVQVYRSEDVRDPRPESQAKIGALMDPAVLLHDLRTHNDKESINTALGVPAGPNSTLSVQLVIPAA